MLPVVCLALSLSAPVPLDRPPAGAGTLSGRVVGPDGTPVPGAKVWLSEWSADRPAARATADPAGRFRLGPVPMAESVGRVALYAEGGELARGYVDHPAVFAGADHDLGDVRLSRGRRFAGLVRDADGNALAGVPVRVEVHRSIGQRLGARVGPHYELTTDEAGGFQTPPLPPGAAQFTAWKEGLTRDGASATVSPGPDAAVEMRRLVPDTPVTIQVKDEAGKPVAGATTSVNGWPEFTSGADGKLVFRGRGPRDRWADVWVEKPGYRADRAYLVAPEPTATLTRNPTRFVAGRAVDADTGAAVPLDVVWYCRVQKGADGKYTPAGYDFPVRPDPAAPDRFRVADLPAGEIRVTAAAYGYVPVEVVAPTAEKEAPAGGVVLKLRKYTGTLPAGTPRLIHGTVTRAGEPVTVGRVVLGTVQAEPSGTSPPMLRGRFTDRDVRPHFAVPVIDGRYVIPVPWSADNWVFSAEEPGRPAHVVGPFGVKAGEAKRLDVAFADPARVSGRVANVPDDLRGELWVVAFAKTGHRATAPVAPDGTFRLDLPPGKYGLKVGHDGYTGERSGGDPWAAATVVDVEAGKPVPGLAVAPPPAGR